jgi:hypothetical protein
MGRPRTQEGAQTERRLAEEIGGCALDFESPFGSSRRRPVRACTDQRVNITPGSSALPDARGAAVADPPSGDHPTDRLLPQQAKSLMGMASALVDVSTARCQGDGGPDGPRCRPQDRNVVEACADLPASVDTHVLRLSRLGLTTQTDPVRSRQPAMIPPAKRGRSA